MLQPPLKPVTVYTVFTVGVTTITELVEPVFQLYVLAPLAVRVAFPPPHTVAPVADMVKPGVTEIVTTALPVQPPLKLPLSV
jgi:hypothetical protein